jgi:catechol 2,3-dioxygenase-like lactoylglutathione lyase family enzyme
VKPNTLVHVALYVSEPEDAARRLLTRLPFRVLERSDEFVLVGRSPKLGKLTFFSAPGPRERGVLVRVGIGIPGGTSRKTIELDDDLAIELVPSEPDGDVTVDHVALLATDPEESAARWERFGVTPAGQVGDVARVHVGSAVIELHPGSPRPTERPILNHLGLLVESIEEAQRSIAERGLAVTREVEGDSSYAVFVEGPDGVELEYIEHKPSFALA